MASCVFFVWYCPFGNKFLFIQKKKKIKLSHLCFADDLFLFSKGNVDSVQITMDELAKFKAFSGMKVNKQKSAVFLAGIEDSVRATILGMTGFSLGSLRMKYLGVPLISSKLSHSDCQPLLDKIMARIQSWTCSSLSLRVDISLYLQFFTAFKHIGALCSSSPNLHVIRSNRFLAGFCGRARM